MGYTHPDILQVEQTGEIPEWFYGAGECEEFGEDDDDE